MKVRSFFIFLLLSNFAYASDGQWSGVIGVEHISSIFDGRPFNDNRELSTDFLYGGIRYKQQGWRLEAMIATSLAPVDGFKSCNYGYVYGEPVDGIQLGELRSTTCKTEKLGTNPRAIFRIEREWTFGD